nr:hypothetical protein [Tanacetum cinerariifolium]
EGSQLGTRRALRSGAATSGDSSNKRAKPSAPKQSDAEYSAVKSSKKGTPVSKLNFEPGEKVVETKLTPVIAGSRKVASELRTAVSATGSPKSRKRRGTPVTEDQGIETNHGAVVDESARRSTRSAGESEGNSAANKQAVSVKTPTSGIGKQSAAKGELSEGSQLGTRRAFLLSGKRRLTKG